MTCACCTPTTQKTKAICPQCGQTSWAVSHRTMQHQLVSPNNMQAWDEDFFCCRNLDCPVAYASEHHVIPKTSLRAYQSGQEPMLCYCFGVSRAVYQHLLEDNTAQGIKAFVVQQTKEKLCACEVRNPSGRCCLADFKAMEDAYDS